MPDIAGRREGEPDHAASPLIQELKNINWRIILEAVWSEATQD
jgi:hypothetical protein